MALDFLPFADGQLITSDDLNMLVASIQDGSIFTDQTYISGMLSANSAQISSLTARVAVLESIQATLDQREQFILTAGQMVIGLSKTPLLDSELLFLNGMALSKTGLPLSFVGDYTISGSTLTLNSQLASTIVAGDLLIVKYVYGV